MSDLETKVDNLSKRLGHLERELDTCYSQSKFEQYVERTFPESATIDTKDGQFGYFARVSDIDGNDVQIAIDRLDNSDYDYAVTETGSGLGMEVWTDDRYL